jgi:SAM-dependent methyltransferase
LEPRYPRVIDPLTGESFAIHACTRCGLGHTLPQPAELGPYYRPAYYGNRHGLTLRRCLDRRLGFLAAALPKGAGKRLLDVGCGDGSFLLAASRAGWQVAGTELSPETARGKGLQVREDIARFTEEGAFDCITMWHTLEHMRDPQSVLRHAHRLLKTDGKLLVAVPDAGGWQARIFGWNWLHLDVPRHLYHFSKDSLDYGLRAAGFCVRRRWHQEFEYDLLGWSQSTLNCLLPCPNVFFDALTGKKGGAGKLVSAAGLLLGTFFTALLLPLVPLAAAAKRGGTIIVLAEKERTAGPESITTATTGSAT